MTRYLKILGLVFVLMFAGVPVVWGAAPSEGLSDGLLNSDNRILSRVTTVAGSGEFSDENGTAVSASFRTPQGIAVLSVGTVLIADTENNRIQKMTDGEVSTYAGINLVVSDETGLAEGALIGGPKEKAVFNGPTGLDVDSEGNVYVADAGNNAIRKITSDGAVVTIAGNGVIGSVDGKGEEARFYHPQGIAVKADGTIYVTDTLNHLIRKITPDGTVSTLNAPSERVVEVTPGEVVAVGDYQDGPLEQAKFNEPTGLVIDDKGNLYVSDSGNQLIRYIDLEKGVVSTVAGEAALEGSLYKENALYAEAGYVDGTANEARFNFPKGIALTKEGGLVIADSLNHAIRYLYDGHVTTLAGNGTHGQADGIEGVNQLHFPTDVAVLSDGHILIADAYNNQIREFSPYQLPEDLPKNDQVNVVLGAEWIPFDAKPEIVNGRTMIPVRVVSEALGYQVDYNDIDKAISIANDDQTTIQLYVGKTVMEIEQGAGNSNNKITKTMDVSPYIRDSRTYVPVRFLSERLGLDVEWSKADRTVILREKE